MTRKTGVRRRSTVTMLSLLLALAGCATYHPQPLSASANAAQFSKRSLDSVGLRTFMQAQLGHPITPWPPQAWTLDQLTLVALHYHPKLVLARTQWASARAKAKTAGAYPNPTLQVNPLQYATNPAAGASPWTIGLAVNIPILTAGKRSDRINEALEQAEAARLDVIQTAWQIRANVRQPWIEWYAARRRAKLLDAQVEDVAALLAVLEQRLQAGQTSQYQMVQTRLEWTNARLRRADARAAERQARAALAGALGVPVAELHGLHFDFDALRRLPAPDKLPKTRFITYALTQRPDIRAALRRYAASEQAVKLEIARQYPNLNIGPGYTWDQGIHKWSIGLSLELPVFNQNQGPIAQARAQRAQRAAQFRVLQERITTDFNRALAAYQSSGHKLKLAQQLLQSSESQLASARASYQAGETNRVDLLRIHLETQNDLLALLQARVQAEKALAALADTVEYPLTRSMPAARAAQNVAPPQPGSSLIRSGKAPSS